MIQVAKNEFYEFNVDIDKNRIYGKLFGFWKKAAQVPEYLADLKAAIDKVKPGFTILSDLRMMKPPTTEVAHLHREAHQIVTESGVGKTAEVLGQAVLIEMQLKKFGQSASSIKADFNTPEEAEAWLDSNE